LVTAAPALPRFIAGPNDRLQTVCNALQRFLDFTGRSDEWLALSRDAEVDSWLFEVGCGCARVGVACV
jgi:hypothetical protein